MAGVKIVTTRRSKREDKEMKDSAHIVTDITVALRASHPWSNSTPRAVAEPEEKQ